MANSLAGIANIQTTFWNSQHYFPDIFKDKLRYSSAICYINSPSKYWNFHGIKGHYSHFKDMVRLSISNNVQILSPKSMKGKLKHLLKRARLKSMIYVIVRINIYDVGNVLVSLLSAFTVCKYDYNIHIFR